MECSIHQRIQHFIDYLGITNNQFAKEIGDSSAKISQVTSPDGSKPDFRISLVVKILSRYPSLSSDWLITGEGPMLKNREALRLPAEGSATPAEMAPNQPMESWKSRLQNMQIEKETIPLVDQKAYASYLGGFTDPDYLDTRPLIYYPELRGLGPIIAIRVQGDSMSPTIMPDDVLLCSYVERGSKIKDNAIYVVCHSEGVVVKRVMDRRHINNTVICRSDNREYPAFEIKTDTMLHLWRVRRRITAFLDKTVSGEERLDTFEHQLATLQTRMGNGLAADAPERMAS
jgi:phage repressor protein C with HTH and peptisase S24 domain